MEGVNDENIGNRKHKTTTKDDHAASFCGRGGRHGGRNGSKETEESIVSRIRPVLEQHEAWDSLQRRERMVHVTKRLTGKRGNADPVGINHSMKGVHVWERS